MIDDEDQGQRPLAMVVDADPLCHMNLETELGEIGYTLSHCRNVAEARLAMVDGARPDLAIVEVVWPDMRGLELAEWFAENRPETAVAVVSVSRRALRLCRSRLPESHAVLPRPLEFEDILGMARTVLDPGGTVQTEMEPGQAPGNPRAI